jgi:hypothetical protein
VRELRGLYEERGKVRRLQTALVLSLYWLMRQIDPAVTIIGMYGPARFVMRKDGKMDFILVDGDLKIGQLTLYDPPFKRLRLEDLP